MAFSQISGSLFMNQNNFYAQMYNPAYARSDGSGSFSFAGLSGINFINNGNFKIADVIVLNSAGTPEIDFDNFYATSRKNNYIRQELSVPVLFGGMSLKNGYFTFFYKENIAAFSKLNQEAIRFLSAGNLPVESRVFNSDEIRLRGAGYREFAFGYSTRKNERLRVGIRAKILFGSAFIDTREWNYGVESSETGDEVMLTANGTGRLMLPFDLRLRPDNSILSVDAKNSALKYLKEYHNPGLAFDLGFAFTKNEKHFFTCALRDLGGIWSGYKSYNLTQKDTINFVGFDLVSAIRYPEESYMNPGDLQILIKDEIRNLYQPVATANNYFYSLSVKSLLHYQYTISERHSMGVTNQMAFGAGQLNSVFTISAMQKWPNFSVFESLNIHDVNDLSLGGGLQYEGDYAQFFIAADNLLAIYHPAVHKTFSVNFGVCFLLNHKKAANSNKATSGNGRTSPYLPFYKELNNKMK